MRRAILLPLSLAVAPLPAARPAAINTSAIRWAGAQGGVVHGYMAIPAKARGRQPAVLVLADPAAGGQAAAHTTVDALARAGFLACCPRGDEPDADLAASLAWLQGNGYATGRVALLALGGAAALRAGEIAAVASRPAAALVTLSAQAPPTAGVPTLGLPPAGADAPLPAAAVDFLREHLR